MCPRIGEVAGALYIPQLFVFGKRRYPFAVLVLVRSKEGVELYV